jgi:hypothetical protein
MSELDNIIQITIRRDTASVETAAFNIPLVLATFTNFSERVRTYTDLDGVAEDFNSSSNVYKIASKLFGQSGNYGRPPSILVGRRQVDEVDISIPTVVVGQTCNLVINGTTYSYTPVSGDSASNVAAGIKTQYDISPKVGVTVTNNLDGTLTARVTTLGTAWSVTTSTNMITEVVTPTETWVDAKDAVSFVNDAWYCLVAETHLDADILALAASIEAEKKIYGTSTSTLGSKASTVTDVGALLNLAGYTRTFITYLPTADTEYPEAAWVGGMLPQIVGAADWDFKRVSGVTVSKLSATEITNLKNKSINRYTRVGGQNIFQEGDMSDGRPIYEIIIKDWIDARMKEGIFFRLVNSLKIPFDRRGFSIIESEMRNVLAQGIANDAIDNISIDVPDPLAVPANLKSQGIAGTFKFTARYKGSARVIIIDGTLTV